MTSWYDVAWGYLTWLGLYNLKSTCVFPDSFVLTMPCSNLSTVIFGGKFKFWNLAIYLDLDFGGKFKLLFRKMTDYNNVDSHLAEFWGWFWWYWMIGFKRVVGFLAFPQLKIKTFTPSSAPGCIRNQKFHRKFNEISRKIRWNLR